MKALLKRTIAAATLLLAGTGVCAEKAPAPAQAPAPAKASAPNAAKTPPADASSKNATTTSVDAASAKASTGVEQLKDQFKTQANVVLAEHARMMDALKKASGAEKEKILADMQKLLDQQRAQGKRIRDDMRKLRQTLPAATPSGGRR